MCSAVALVFEGWSSLGRLVGRARGARRGTAGRVGRPPTGHMGRATGAQEGSRGVRAGRDPRGAALPPRVRRRRHPSAHPVSVTRARTVSFPSPSVRFEEALTAHLVLQPRAGHGGSARREPAQLGATRTYLPHDGWQGSVRETAHRCQAIFLLGGLTNSLSWEIQQLRDWGMLGKTLILLPPDPDAQRSLQRLQLIEELLGLEPIESEHWLYPGWVAVGGSPTGEGGLLPVGGPGLGGAPGRDHHVPRLPLLGRRRSEPLRRTSRRPAPRHRGPQPDSTPSPRRTGGHSRRTPSGRPASAWTGVLSDTRVAGPAPAPATIGLTTRPRHVGSTRRPSSTTAPPPHAPAATAPTPRLAPPCSWRPRTCWRRMAPMPSSHSSPRPGPHVRR